MPLGPGAGVLIPDDSWAYSSPSVSDGASDEGSDERGWGEGVDRWMLITGVSGSCLRNSWGGGKAGLMSEGGGGGDLRRGEMGHRGEVLEDSTAGFRGCGAPCDGSKVGGSTGVVTAVSWGREEDERTVDDFVRVGLGSCTLLVRERAPADGRLVLPVVVLALGLAGEGSLDASGEAVKDVFVDEPVHLEGWVSALASCSLEFRLDRLASRPAVLAL